MQYLYYLDITYIVIVIIYILFDKHNDLNLLKIITHIILDI